MRRLLPLLALVPATALAKVPPDGAVTVEAPGAVELPLLGSDAGVPTVIVQVKGPGEEATAQDVQAVVDLTFSQMVVSKGLAAQLDPKTKKATYAKQTAPVDYIIIPELHLGTIVLKDVTAHVADVEGGDLVLGMATERELASALLASKGVFKVVPAAQATALLGEVGTPQDLLRVVPADFYEHGTSVSMKVTLTGAGKIAGHEGQIALRTSKQLSYADPFDANENLITDHTVDSPQFGGLTLPPVTVKRNPNLDDPNDQFVGALGWDALNATDIAVDPDGMRFAIKAVTPKVVDSAAPTLAENARKTYADATKEPATPPEPDPKAVGQGDKGDATKVSVELDLAGALSDARFYTSGGGTEALAHYKAAAEAAGDACEPHQAYGTALMQIAGDPAAAIPEFKRAAEAYDRWIAQDYFARGKISEGKNDDPDAFVVAQTCSTAWGDLAEAYLAQGDDENVEQIYKLHADLDADLPLAYGLSLMRAGKPEAAIGPLRRAMDLDRENDPVVRSALFVSGDPAARSAAGIARLSTAGVGEHLYTASPVIESARSAGGNGEARKVAQALADGAPSSVPARLLLAREVSDAERKDVLAGAEKALAAYRASHGNSPQADAWEGLYYAISANNLASITAMSAEVAGDPEVEMAAAVALRDEGDLSGAKDHRNALVKHVPLTAVTAIESTRLDSRLPGLPGSPRPPRQAPAQTYTTGCAEIPAASYDAPLTGTWVTLGDTKDRIAFTADRWCVFDDTGAIRAKGAANGYGVYACPAATPAADQPLQETYFVFRDAEHALTTCNRYVQVGDKMGIYAQACPGDAPYNAYGASSRLGEWQRTQEAAPAACWTDPAPAPAPGKKGR